jgi:hypothetical protein
MSSCAAAGGPWRCRGRAGAATAVG